MGNGAGAVFGMSDLIEDHYKEDVSKQIFEAIVKRAGSGEVEAVRWLTEYGYMQVKRHAPVILVSVEVLTGIEAVRVSGETNMLDYRRVADLASETGWQTTSDWIRDNDDDYCRGVLQGFTLDEEPDGWSEEAVADRVKGEGGILEDELSRAAAESDKKSGVGIGGGLALSAEEVSEDIKKSETT